MNFISNIKKIGDDKINFEINNKNNEIKISFVNALRRTIISDIETYVIDINKVLFFENNSILNNEFLSHRLSLIPINSDIPDFDYENLLIQCSKKNSGENIMSVYVNDFILKNNITNEIYDNKLIFTDKISDILFAKLKVNQFFSFEASLIKNKQSNSGSQHCPVSTCLYTFAVDEKASNDLKKNMTNDEKISFDTQEIERIYSKNSDGAPLIYNMVIESIGFYSPLKILNLGINILISKLDLLKIEFDNLNSSKISLLTEEIDNAEFFEFLLDDENDTIGNLVTSYLLEDDSVFYCGYIIKHPLKKNIEIKIKLKNDNTLENVISTIKNIISKIIKLLEKMENNKE